VAVRFSSQMLFFISSLFFLIIAFELTWLHSPYGSAMSMDSLSYLSVAQQINLGHGVSLPDYAMGGAGFLPMTLWPPLYPLLMSVVIPDSHVFGVQSGYYIMWVNIICLWVLLVLFWAITKNFVGNKIAFFTTPLLGFMPSMQVIYLYAWSETLFIPVILAAFYCFSFAFKSNKHRLYYILASIVFMAIGFHLRYAALGFLGGVILSIFFLEDLARSQKIKVVSISIGLFVLLIAPLLIRNYLMSGTPIGHRDASTASFLLDLNTLGGLLGGEFFSSSLIVWPLTIVGLASLITVVVLQRDAVRQVCNYQISLVIHAGLWTLIYLVFLIINRLLSHMDLDTRMIGPIVPFVLLIVAGLFYSSVIAIKHQGVLKPIWLLVPVLFVAPLLAKAYNIHRDLIISWRELGAPGQILGIFYNSTTSHDLAAFQRLGEVVPLSKGAVVLTDLARPQIIHYFFPDARIMQMTTNLSSTNIPQLVDGFGQQGLIVITQNKTLNAFSEIVTEDAFLQIQDREGEPYRQLMLLKLPLALPNQK
jgi:hypothetical protein